MNTAQEAQKELSKVATKERALICARYFKTGPGEYGEGDVFRGVTVPVTRNIAKKFREMPLEEIEKLLSSTFHEDRSLALYILVLQYEKAEKLGDTAQQKKIWKWYCSHTKNINNWDLVDSSAPYVFGPYLRTLSQDERAKILTKFARSKSLWERRIAMVGMYAFIKKREHEQAFSVVESLLSDSHDLMHKAIGWMLREVGKSSGEKVLLTFLKKHYAKLPRTTLRYAIERFPKEMRDAYLKGVFA